MSAIRIVDRVTKRPAEKDKRATMAKINLVISLKSGDFLGRGKVKVLATSPAGKRMGGESVESEVELLKDGGANVIAEIQVAIEEDGVYWFDILFEDKQLIRTPLTVVSLESGSTTPTSIHESALPQE